MGQGYGLTATEMNLLLKEEGFLEGNPGMYAVTAKGKPFAGEQLHSRGTGGSIQFNPAWVQRTWDPSIEDKFDITDERRQRLRKTASAVRDRKGCIQRGPRVQICSGDIDDGRTNEFSLDPFKVVAGLALATIAIYGIREVAPHVKALWTDKTAPGLKRLRSRAAGGAERQVEKVGDDDPST